jgi:hypothetical protein
VEEMGLGSVVMMALGLAGLVGLFWLMVVSFVLVHE